MQAPKGQEKGEEGHVLFARKTHRVWVGTDAPVELRRDDEVAALQTELLDHAAPIDVVVVGRIVRV